MSETAVVAFTTFFATIGPLDIGAVFAALTAHESIRYRRVMALRGILIAAFILFSFAFGGEFLLKSMGISLAALSCAGGILLLLIGIDMVFARPSLGPTNEEEIEAAGKHDLSVFPIATPLIAGPGTMGAVILLMANAQGDYVQQAVVLGALLAILLLTLSSLLLAAQIQQVLGITGMRVISRVMGVLLSALAVQFIFDGIRQSGLLGG